MRRLLFGIAPLLGSVLLSPSVARGQPDLPPEPGPKPPAPAEVDERDEQTEAPGEAEGGIVPPELEHAPPIAYPETVAKPAPTSVLMLITIDEEGRVSEPSVVEGAGEPFDSLALDAIVSFRFKPALAEGKPIAARLQYRLVFTPPEPPPPAPTITPPSPSPLAEPHANAAGASRATEPNERAAQPVATTAPSDDEMFEAVAEVKAPRREVTRRSIEQKELTRMPGTRGDALKAVEVLPGVGRTTFGTNPGPPVIRGALPLESMVTLDGAPISTLYHFGGLTSVYNSHLLESVDLYPGNFSARYGRVSSGVVEARTRDPRSDGFHGMLELSLVDNFALVESPVAENTSFALAARRSNLDFVFEKLVPDDSFGVVAAPVYYDYQAMLVHRFGDRHKLKWQAFGSYDSLKLVFANPSDEDPALRDSVEIAAHFHQLQGSVESRLSSRVQQNIEVALGLVQGEQALGAAAAKYDGLETHSRAEWGIFANDALRVDLGVDMQLQAYHFVYEGPPPPVEDDPSSEQPFGTYEFISTEQRQHVVRPGGYLEFQYRPLDDLVLIPGLRVDYDRHSRSWMVDPRFSARYALTEQTTLKGGVGLYSQPPEFYYLIEQFGNPELEPYRALHTSFGVEHKPFRGFEVGVEGFYKRQQNRIVGTPGGTPPLYVNGGEGRVYGLEVSAELRRRRHFGYLAYTLSRSERRGPGGQWRLFEYDQTHNLSAVYNYDFGAGWSLGARFRLTTGNPETPVVGGVYDANSDLYRAVYGPTYSERAPTFHQLDLRAEKRWAFEDWSLTAYLEVLNAYNHENVEGTRYSFDYSEKEAVTGLPIFPNLGIRGEL